MAAAASPLPDDYVTDWVDELQRVAAAAASLSPAARAAVIAVIDSFAAGDGFLPRAASQARTMLAVRVEPDTTTTLAETLLVALTLRLQSSLSRRPVQTAA